MQIQQGSSALILFSGGQDSTTCLYWAKNRFFNLVALSFDYGQRHTRELESAFKICSMAEVEHVILETSIFNQIGGNALTDDIKIKDMGKKDELPNTFVPGRNLYFLTVAAAFAYQRGIHDLVTGVCQTDYSGYPDCRDETIKALQETLSLGMEAKFRIHTPLMWLTKSDSIHLAIKEGALEALGQSHTCYEGEFPPCGKCPACKLRSQGFQEAGIADPLLSE